MTCLALAGKVRRLRRQRVARPANRRGQRPRRPPGGRSQIAGVAEQADQAEHPQARAGLAKGLAPASFRLAARTRGSMHGHVLDRDDHCIQSTNMNSFVMSNTWASCSQRDQAANGRARRAGIGRASRNRSGRLDLGRVGRPGQDRAVERGDPGLGRCRGRRRRAGRPGPWPARSRTARSC